MTHTRNRYLTDIIKKKLAYSPVVAIQGPRQCGKSFLAKKLISEKINLATYVTFDRAGDRTFAQSNPESFLLQHEARKPLIIDEAQKVPAIFDAIKYSVDELKTPGRFILLGSTEFSKLTLVRETLTGRISKARLFPFTLSESRHLAFQALNKKAALNPKPLVSRSDLIKYLARGGLPGIFSVNNVAHREALFGDWIALTVERDIHNFPKVKANSEVAYKIMEGIARLDAPDQARLTSYCGRDYRTVAKHLEILKTLFVIVGLQPHALSTGKETYYLCDVGLVNILGGDFRQCLKTYALMELLAKNEYAQQKRRYYYYRNTKGSLIDFIEENDDQLTALKLISKEQFDSRDFAILIALRNKHSKVKLKALGPAAMKLEAEKIEVLPWESVA